MKRKRSDEISNMSFRDFWCLSDKERKAYWESPLTPKQREQWLGYLKQGQNRQS